MRSTIVCGVQAEASHATFPNRPCGLKASTSAMSANVNVIEYCVQHSMPAGSPVDGRYDAEKVSTSATRSEPGGGAQERAHPADDHDDERVEQPEPVLPRGDATLRGADRPAHGRQRRADDEGDREGALDVDPERRRHLPVVYARTDDHPRSRAVEPCPERDSDDDAEREDEPGGSASTGRRRAAGRSGAPSSPAT